MSRLTVDRTGLKLSLRLGLLLVLLVVFAAGCGGNDTTNGTDVETPAVEEPGVEEPVEEPTEEMAEEPTEEPAEEPTEEMAEEPTEEPAEEPTEEMAEEPAAPEGPAVSGDLNILGFGQGDEVATVRFNRFLELYPDVNVNAPEGSLEQQQFLTAVASGNPPDLIYTGRDVLSTYAARGALMPLEDCVANFGIDLSQYRPSAVEQVTVDGTLYGIPEFFNVILMLMDDDVLAEVGLTPEDIDTSDWDQIAAVNEQMTAYDGDTLTRIGFDPKLPEFFPLWVRANGGQLISDDGRTAMLNTPEAIEALEFTVGLHDVAGGRQEFIAFRDTWDFFGGQNMFVQDQLGAFPMEQWYLNVLAEASPDTDISSAPFLDREGNPISFATGNTWAIPVGSQNPDAACAFMKTMTEPEAWIAAAEERRTIREADGRPPAGVYSGNLLADEVIFGEIVPTVGNEDLDAAMQIVLDVQDIAFVIPGGSAGAEFRQAWVDAVNRVLNGEQTAEEALNQAQEEAQEALDEGWEQ